MTVKDSLGFAGVIILAGSIIVGVFVGVIYAATTVVKWAWGG